MDCSARRSAPGRRALRATQWAGEGAWTSLERSTAGARRPAAFDPRRPAFAGLKGSAPERLGRGPRQRSKAAAAKPDDWMMERLPSHSPLRQTRPSMTGLLVD